MCAVTAAFALSACGGGSKAPADDTAQAEDDAAGGDTAGEEAPAEEEEPEVSGKYASIQEFVEVGMFLWGRIPEKYGNAEELTERVLHEARVFITPGFIFGSNGERYVRISLCAKEEKMAEALKRIKEIKL